MSVASAPLPPAASADLVGWNRSLNATHAMSALRARGGWVVTAIEARRRRLVADAVRRLAPRAVVDAGCEDGWLAQGYADCVARLTLVDIDPDVLARAPLARRAHVRTLAADVADAHALRAGLGAGAADVVVLSALLEHLPRPAAALAALGGVLRAGGRLVVYLPADGPILALKAVLRRARLGGLVRGLSLDPAPGHLHRFGRRDVARLLRPFGAVESLTFDPVCLGFLCVVRKR